jgi:hypothetical protein
MDTYLSQIEESYARCRGCRSMLSPIDWHLAQSWEDAGIPIHIVLRAMSDCCEAFHRKKTPGKINALKYFEQEVQKQYMGWKESRVGANTADAAGTQLLEENESDAAIARLEEIILKYADAKSRVPAEFHCWLDLVKDTCMKIILELESSGDIMAVERALSTLASLFNQALITHHSFTGSDTDRLFFLKAQYNKFSLPRLTLYEL